MPDIQRAGSNPNGTTEGLPRYNIGSIYPGAGDFITKLGIAAQFSSIEE